MTFRNRYEIIQSYVEQHGAARRDKGDANMATVTHTIRTAKNVWTFDVSLPPSGIARILRIHGDVTNKANLDEAIELLKAKLAEPKRAKPGRPRKA